MPRHSRHDREGGEQCPNTSTTLRFVTQEVEASPLLEFVGYGEDVGGYAAVDHDVLAGGVGAVG